MPQHKHTTYLSYFGNQQRLAILKHDSKVVVAISNDSGKIAGFVTYKELIDEKAAKNPSLWQKLVYHVTSVVFTVQSTLRRWIYKEDFRGVDRHFSAIGKSQKLVNEKNPGHPGSSHYNFVAWLGVHPDFQGQGVGGQLLQYGIDLDLPLYLEASPKGYPVYLRKGFKELKARCDMMDFEGNVIESIPTMLHPGKKNL